MSLNLHLLRLFESVARHQSFSRAAEALHVSQPAVSKGVRELEAQLGTPLLERGPGGVRPTEAGRILLVHARTVFSAEQAAEDALGALRGLRGGTLRIGASTTIATYFLPPLLGAFHRAYPDVDLRLTSANTVTVADLLMRRELDVALVEGPLDPGEILVQPWREDELVFIAAANHPLASRPGPLPLKALADETIVLREPGSGTRDTAWNALAQAGFTPRRILEIGGNEVIIRVVAAGLGIGILSAVAVADQEALGRLRTLPVAGITIRRLLTRLVLPNRQPSPATVAFDRLLDGQQTKI
ncbi:LysR substrate-binding domain-containing protein [Microvirga sp. 17 mud 1-3]|uniref:LysR substrate-binding domain-containing protein n=1 Tax=Microvirga sp. 17 mud 1-3 TaxID=2082949 RepID=UPI000D6CC85D|nr:LysR substrate-binding domain-containing protein [Microvirga sp. 17 mud 1-3]AWM88717.1 LysR family transcriptional regulator [Microvirga sp. 17 mud 1-3]